MDVRFPSVLFPCFYNTEPPDSGQWHSAGSWGSYEQITAQRTQSLRAQHTATGPSWSHTEPVPVPLLCPKNGFFWSSKPADPLDFTEHLQNFFQDHPTDAFGTMASVLGQTMDLSSEPQKKVQKTATPPSVCEWTAFMTKRKSNNCPRRSRSARLDAYSRLLSDAVHSVPVELLGSLLHEELSQQSRDAQLCEANSGGALDIFPLPPSAHDSPLTTSHSACMVYCSNGVDKLSFQQVELHPREVICSDEVSSFLLKGPIQQITSSSLCGHSCVAVRSLYHCGVWSVTSAQQPHLLQAMSSADALSCTCLSPHVVGELLVAAESGAAHLWRLGHGLQQVRMEDSNLYFNSQSSWRWCEFSAHPRVMLYADRTGVELTDIRVKPSSCHTLFRISQTSECRSGERLLLSRYLSPLHSFHHLVCTQYSAYIMDERFPCVPMLKCDHMMEAPPVFCHALPGGPNSCSSSGGVAKILLGSQRSQEVTLLQYSGGRAEACVSHGPVKALLRPRDSVDLLPPQLPHRAHLSQERLSLAATGLSAVHLKMTESDQTFCVFQLLQTGDIFYQILERDKCGEVSETHADVSHASGQVPGPPRDHTRPTLLFTQRDVPLSSHSLSIWRQWLQRVARSHKANKDKPHVMVKRSLRLSKKQTRNRDQTCQMLHHLKNCMFKRTAAAGPAEPIVPLTEEVHPEDWPDDLSTRLTVAWDSVQGWHTWWTDHLLSNREERTEALRRRRRKQKEARRLSGLSLLSMSGSFTSTISYQSDLSELSDWGWTDSRGVSSQSEDPTTYSQDKGETPVSTQEEGSATQTCPPDTPTTDKRTQHLQTRPPDTPTERRAQHLQTRPPVTPTTDRRAQHLQTRPPDTPTADRRAQHLQTQSLEPSPSSSVPLSSIKPVELSRESFSRSLTASQRTSQRPSQSFSQTSQSSQPKKKSRMGF